MDFFTTSQTDLNFRYEHVEPLEQIRHGKDGCRRILCEIRGNELYIKCRSCGEIVKFLYNKEKDKIEMVG